MSEGTTNCSSCGRPIAGSGASASLCARCDEVGEEAVTAVIAAAGAGTAEVSPRIAALSSTVIDAPEIPGLRILGFLGRGGMGVVWLAEQVATGRQVAVKLVRRGAAWAGDPMFRARFEREIELAARLDHPNIARIFDGGEAEGLPYCVMEYIEGTPVSEHIRERSLDREPCLVIMGKIADAVDHAHRRGVLHRDLKPGNILVTSEGEPKLLDFGLARGLDDAGQTLTIEGGLAGTPAYMSPEQARGESRLIDTRSDVYSLGVIFYELLTGHHPYPVDGPLEQVLGVVGRSEVTRPRAHVPDMPPDLEMLLLHSLAATPAERYASAGELAADIRRFLRDEPLAAGRTSTVYFVRKWASRHRAACAGAAALLLAGTVATVYHWRTLNREKLLAQAAERQASEALDKFLRSAITENMQRGNFRQVLEFIAQAEARNPAARDELVFERIEALAASGDAGYLAEVERLDREQLSPAWRARLDYWKAERLLDLGKREEAVELLGSSLESGLLPAVEGHMARAALCATVDQAVVQYAAAAELSPWRSVAQKNLILGLMMLGKVDEARARITVCRVLFPEDDTLFGLEAVLEALQDNGARAMELVGRMKESDGGGKNVLRAALPALAKFSRSFGASLRGEPSEMTLVDQLLLTGAINRVHVGSSGRSAAPVMTGTGPVLARGLGGLTSSLLAYQSGKKEKARETILQALESCNTGYLWALLSLVELDLDHFDNALAAAAKAQTEGSIFPGVAEASAIHVGLIEARRWIKGGMKDGLVLERANAAFRKVFREDVTASPAQVCAAQIAVRVGDLVFARRLAQAMPADGAERLKIEAKIEHLDGNVSKALGIAERAAGLYPDDAEIREMVARMRAGDYRPYR